MNKYTRFFCVAVGLALGGPACAQTTWTLGTGPTQSGGVTVTPSAWANTAGAGASSNGSTPIENQAPPPAPVSGSTGLVLYGGGLGIHNKDGCLVTGNASGCDAGEPSTSTGEHAIDNDGRYEMVLLTFDKLVDLTHFQIGWSTNDSDMTVMAYAGTGTPTLAGSTWASLIAAGWTAISNVFNVPTNTMTATNLTTYSSYWLIGAYNDLASGGSSSYLGALDYVKLSQVKGIICTDKIPGCTPPPPGGGVPEPGSLALLALALFGMTLIARRRLSR